MDIIQKYKDLRKKIDDNAQIRAEKAAQRAEERLEYSKRLEENLQKKRNAQIQRMELEEKRRKQDEKIRKLQAKRTQASFPFRQSSASSFLGSQLSFGGGGSGGNLGFGSQTMPRPINYGSSIFGQQSSRVWKVARRRKVRRHRKKPRMTRGTPQKIVVMLK